MKSVFKYCFFLNVFFIACLLFSCSKPTVLEVCANDQPIIIKLQGYSLNECDSIIVYRYQAKTNYATLIDSISISNLQTTSTGVSFEIKDRSTSNQVTFNQYDIQIFNLFDAKNIRIANIEREQQSKEVCYKNDEDENYLKECSNPLLSFNCDVNNGSIDIIDNTIIVEK